ncbi:Zinc finger protein 40, partial [Ophiophagus hannah]
MGGMWISDISNKIEEAQKKLNETEDSKKDISKAITRGSTDTVKGVKRKKIVPENHQTKIPKSPLRTPAQAKSKEKVEDRSSSSKILHDNSELLKEPHNLASQNGKQIKQNVGTFNSEVAIKISTAETILHTKPSLLPQSLDLNKWSVEEYSSTQLNLPVKKGSASCSSISKIDNNECISFVDCNNSSSCTNTAFDVLLKAMEPELNTLAHECPSSGMQMDKLRPNRTVNTSSSLASNTRTAQSHDASLQQKNVAASQFYPCTSQTVHVTTSGKTSQAQMHSAAHSKEQVPAKAGQHNQQVTACPNFTSSVVHQQNQENLKLQHIYSTAVTSSVTSQSSVSQAFCQNHLVAKSSSPLSINPALLPSSTAQIPIAPLYNSAQIASVVNHGAEQICNLLKVQKPKKMGKYVCEYCNRACAKPSVLLKHIRSHTGERPYPCETCGFSFKTKSNLYKHKKSHAHAIKVGRVLQPDSSGLFLSHESDKALSIHSDVEESGDSDDEGTADERQDDQGSLELEPTHVVKIPSNSEPSRKGNPISLSNSEYLVANSSFQESTIQARTTLPKVVVYPINMSPLQHDCPKVTVPTSTVTNVKSDITYSDLIKDFDTNKHQKKQIDIYEEHPGTPIGATIHAQLQRQQATDCSQDQGKCLLSPRSLGSTDSGYFSRSESADQTMSPPAPFLKGPPTTEKDLNKICGPRMSTTVVTAAQTTCADKSFLSSGQMRPPLATKTLEERISKLISDNEAVVDDKQLDSVKPRRTSLSRRGSIDSPKSYIFKDSFQFDLKPMGRRTSSSSDIPKSPFTPTEKSKQVFLLSVPTLDCLPITRSNSMPTTSYSAIPTNVIPPPHPLRGSQSFDDKIASLYDDVFVPGPSPPQLQAGHARTLVRQTAIEDSSSSEGHTFGPARSVDESYGCSVSNEFLMARSKSFVQGSNLDKIKKSHQGRGIMFECETCRNRYRKLENFENHKKFYCSELHGPKTKAAIRDSEHKTIVNSTQPQILHYRVATSTGVWEQTPQIRKRRKMKSVGDEDDEAPTNDTSSLSKNVVEVESQNKLGDAISKQAALLDSYNTSVQRLAQDETETQITEQATEPKILLHGKNHSVPIAHEKNELKRQGAGISVIQHTNSLSRPSSFEKSDSFERISPISFPANKPEKYHSLNNAIKEEKHPLLSASQSLQAAEAKRHQIHHECRVSSNEKNATVQPLRLVRQHNIQVPEILVTEEPDRDQECQCSDLEKTEKFNWPQRSETLSKLPTEKLPPKKKRIRLAEIEQSSADSSFESTHSRSFSRESSLSRASSFSASFDKDELAKNENASRADPVNKSVEFIIIPPCSNTLSVPGPHYREMRRAASEQINCTQPSMEVFDSRSKSFDYGSVTTSKPASLKEISSSKLNASSGGPGHVPLLERRRGPLVRQISLNIAPEKNLPDTVSHVTLQTALQADTSAESYQRLQSSETPLEDIPSGSQHPQNYSKTLQESVKSNNFLNFPSTQQSLGSSLNYHDQQSSLSRNSQACLKGSALGTQKNANQHCKQEDCFAPKYQLHIKTLQVEQQYPSGLPGIAGMDQAGPSLEIFSKLNNNMSKPYVAQQLQQTVLNNNSSSVYQAEPFVVPVRIHSNIPSYGLASVAPIPQILVTQDQPISLFENLVYEMEGKMPVSLGSLNLIQKVPVGGLFPQQEATASSKRMLSPANSLDIAMEKHQKRVKDESGAVSITGAVSLDPLNIKPNELNKQKKPLLVRQSCTTEPLESFPLDPDDKSGGANNSSDVLLSGSPESAQSKNYSFVKDSLEQDSLTTSGTTNFAGRRPHQSVPQNTPSFLKILGDSQERMSPEFSENKKPDIQAKSGTIFSAVNTGNLTKHMKSKAHSKKCMDLGVSVGLIDDQDLEDYGEKQRLNYEPSGFDPEDSDGPEDEDNDNEDDDEDSQAESVLSATPSVSASPQHHPSRNASHEVSSADEESRVLDCFAGVHTDSVDGLPKALLTKMTVLSTVQLDCRNSGPPVAAISREAKKESMQDRATSTEPAVSSETFHRSPCHQMYVDFPGTKEVLRSTTPSISTTATLKSTASIRLPSVPIDQSTQTTIAVPSVASPFAEMQEQKHGEHQQTIKLGPPQTHLFSHLPLHSQQQTKSPYGVVPVGGIHVVPAGLATYSTFLPIPAGPVQLTIPAVSVIHRTTSALGNPACAVSGTANHLGIAEVNSMVPCIPIGQINVPGIQSLSAPALQPLPSLSMETVNILGLAGTSLAPQLHHSGLTLNAVGLQVLTANPSSQRTSSPQAHIPGLQILNIALPTLAPPVSPKAADDQGIVEPPASRNNTCETFQDQGSGSLATPDPAQIGSAPSSQKAPADKRYSIENRLEVGPARDYRRRDIPDNPDSESFDSEKAVNYGSALDDYVVCKILRHPLDGEA